MSSGGSDNDDDEGDSGAGGNSNIFIVYLDDDDDRRQNDDDYDESSADTFLPSSGPTPVPPERDTGVRQCVSMSSVTTVDDPMNTVDGNSSESSNNNNNNNNNSTTSSSNNPQNVWSVAPIDFVYSIQLDSLSESATTMTDDDDKVVTTTTTLTKEGETTLLKSLSKAMADSIYDKECAASHQPPTMTTQGNDDERNNDEIVTRRAGYRHQRGRRRLGDSSSTNNYGDNKVVLDETHLRNSNHNTIITRHRQLGIQSISSGMGHRIIGGCLQDGEEEEEKEEDTSMQDTNTTTATTNSNNNNNNNATVFDYKIPSCAQIGGIVLIGFDTHDETTATATATSSSFHTVGKTVIDRIQDDMTNGIYLDQVNRDMEPFDVQVSSIQFEYTNYFDKVDQGVFSSLQSNDWANQSPSGLSTFSKIAIPLVLLLFLFMCCFCWCSYTEYAKILRRRFAVVIYGDGHYSDSEDYSEDGNSHFEPYRKPKVVETFHHVQPEPNNLSRKSSYMDVGHCNRPECKLCRHQSNRRAVSMIGELSKDFGGDEEIVRRDAPSVIHNNNIDNFHNEPGMVSFVKVDSILHKTPNNKNRIQQPLRNPPKPQSSPTSPWTLVSNLYRGNNNNNNNNDNLGTMVLGDLTCDPREVHLEVVDSDDRSDDDLDFKSIPVPRSSTMYTYAPFTSSSKVDFLRTTWSLPTNWLSSPFNFSNDDDNHNQNNENQDAKGDASTFSGDSDNHNNIQRQRSIEDSIVQQRTPAWAAAYNPTKSRTVTQETQTSMKKKTNSKLFQLRRQQSLGDLPRVPVGRKRTLTDDHGQIRQEVSL
ncbi:hypothetical protein IV203_017202 [Nitzschia inconspicua]|uniref:Uncharacterized protein n=1 Tax=Nitzschia inconspicua TaxID=303405 RepID=A0A9K3KRF8_9STRA|nr:hypothetical protein IV203_017202 [Nitzschia inconspicua]